VTWIAVAVGGALGSLARHGVNSLLQARSLAVQFPVGTLAVNLFGCLVIGLVAGLLASDRLVLRTPSREFVFGGLLGGFTTFSSFGLETLLLARGDSAGQATLNVAAQVLGGLVAAWCGYQLGGRSA
jgi:CrcB protein